MRPNNAVKLNLGRLKFRFCQLNMYTLINFSKQLQCFSLG